MTTKKEKVDMWMPLFIGDYLSSTSRLTTEQHGAYLLIIMDYWKNGPPPNDPAVLAQITRMSLDAWSIASRTVLAFFEQRDGMLVHGRIEQEKADAAANKSKKVAKATAAAAARWNKDASSNAPSMPQAMLEQCPSPSPSPSPNGDIKTIGAGAPAVVVERRQANLDAIEEQLNAEVAAAQGAQSGAVPAEPGDDKPPRFEGKRALMAEGVGEQLAADFIKLRAAKRAPLSQSALNGIKREAEKAGLSLADAVLLCVERGWQGFKADWITSRPNATVANRTNGRPSINAFGSGPIEEDDPFNNFRRAG